MSERKLPAKWQQSAKAAKAVQVAFDMDEKVQYCIRKQALDEGISPSDQIRHILELPVNRKPKRPRLTVSLNGEDYARLAERYSLEPEQQLEIKRKVMEELADYTGQQAE
ncbi:hypothetical protein [Motilimonas pumila]|uniref:Uncharacterized protein n=1 Tax=Motilimonas pumila TaxID=2303987 RepID=A0A418YAV1_9GAMM|nr:hypothetical protein [Motilimonas pumila]RJG40095.1 hypothetical protein D1Z90_17230 [Motilimonas pumila]